MHRRIRFVLIDSVSTTDFNSELLKTERRLVQEDFRGCRHLLRNDETFKIGTTYEDLFASGFSDYILSSKKVLDLGAGNGLAGAELRNNSRNSNLVLHAASYCNRSDCNGVLESIYDKVFYGDVVSGSVQDYGYDAIMDSYGAFSYTFDLSGLITKIANFLVSGGALLFCL